MTGRLAAHLESLPFAANAIKRRHKNGEVKKEANGGLSLAVERRRKGKTKVNPTMVIAKM